MVVIWPHLGLLLGFLYGDTSTGLWYPMAGFVLSGICLLLLVFVAYLAGAATVPSLTKVLTAGFVLMGLGLLALILLQTGILA